MKIQRKIEPSSTALEVFLELFPVNTIGRFVDRGTACNRRSKVNGRESLFRGRDRQQPDR
jgi:hypothetical protein